MLNLSDIFKENELKFMPEQVNKGLLKSGHITKKEYKKLQKIDKIINGQK